VVARDALQEHQRGAQGVLRRSRTSRLSCFNSAKKKAADATPITTSSTSPSTSPQTSSPFSSRLPSCAHKLPMERAPTGAGMDQGQDGMPPGDQGKVEGDDSALAAMELSRTINTSARSLANRALSDWKCDVAQIQEASGGHALMLLAPLIFDTYDLCDKCNIDPVIFRAFLKEIESNYGTNQYHNSIHGCDVMLSTHHFLQMVGVTDHLTHLQLLATLLGALVHDYNHPGTTNAHEVKVNSQRAICYSDQSILERHHLASAFTVLNDKRFAVLAGLNASDYRYVRGQMIDLVLHTDLSKHFEFNATLKSLAQQHGRSTWESRRAAQRRRSTCKSQKGVKMDLDGVDFSSRSTSLTPCDSGSVRGAAASGKSGSLSMQRRQSRDERTARMAAVGANDNVPRRHSAREPDVRRGSCEPDESGPRMGAGSARAELQPDDEPTSRMGRFIKPGGGSKRSNAGAQVTQDPEARQGCVDKVPSPSPPPSPPPDDDTKRVSIRHSNSDQERKSDADKTTRDGNNATIVEEWATPFLDQNKMAVQTMLIAAIKYADLGHTVKPRQIHIDWSERITREFWVLGDLERSIGVPVSPLCDREKDSSIASSQIGFFKFICLPFYDLVADLASPDMEPIASLHENYDYWVKVQADEQAAAQKEIESTAPKAE